MISGIMAGAANNLGVDIIDPIIGVTTLVTQTTASLTLAVPAGATTGDKLLAVLRCRADRSFAVPSGWSTVLSIAVPSGSTLTSDVRVYILSKDYASESNIVFTQSVSAACTGSLILIRGSLGTIASSYTSPLAYTKTTNSSYMLTFVFDNSYSVVSGTATRITSPAGYEQIAHGYFTATMEVYGFFISKKGLESLGSLSYVVNWPGGYTTQRCVAAIEIFQP